jgi:hypothetical protein
VGWEMKGGEWGGLRRWIKGDLTVENCFGVIRVIGCGPMGVGCEIF